MDAETIRQMIKEIIADVANLDPSQIGDNASFIEDLKLDSLSMLEIGVDVDYQFKLGVSDETLGQVRSVQQSVDLVQRCLAEKPLQSEVA